MQIQTKCTREEWEKFIEGKPVNKENVSEKIYNSWLRSKEYGVNPFTYPSTWTEKDMPLAVDGKLSLNFSYLNKQQLKELASQYGYQLHVYNNKGRLVCDLVGLPLNEISLSENVVGTNAVCLALMNNRPETVTRYEHYVQLAHNCYCHAVPFHNKKGEIVGAINVMSYEPHLFAMILAIFVAQICSVTCSYLNFYDDSEINIDYSGLNKIIQNIPQGIAYIDYRNVIRYYNEKALEILNISKEHNAKNELKKYISVLNDFRERKNSDILVKMNDGSKKSVMVTAREIIGKSKLQKDKIVIFEEKNRFLKLKQLEQSTSSSIHICTFDSIIGNNSKIIELKQIAKQIAGTSAPVLIYGESGTGKELFAQAIHNASLRNNHPFIPINCGAIPMQLIESELFGYEPGAFTGALKNGKEGLLETASDGTLFLDEIESMPLNGQVKLLRALSSGRINKVGGTKEKPVDVRIISASKLNLLEEADSNRFREDLYYRLSTIILKIPPLRERKDDIPLLARHFIEKTSSQINLGHITIGQDYLEALLCYYWRGNVRELENVITGSVLLMGKGETELRFKHLPEKIQKSYTYKTAREKLLSSDILKGKTCSILRSGEEILIETTLEQYNYNLSKAATVLGISRKTLYNKMHSNDHLRKLVSH